MTSKKMWFGTKEKMTWINCPAFNAPTSPVGWSVGGTLLNGGAWSRSSKTSHREYDFNWNLASAEDIYKVQDYASGLYGDGPFYFVMPGTESNILPEYYANPAMAAGPSDAVWRLKRKNLIQNPSFETGTAGLSVGGAVVASTTSTNGTVFSGTRSLRVDVVDATSANAFAYALTAPFPAGGKFLGISTRARKGAGGTNAVFLRSGFYVDSAVGGWLNSQGMALGSGDIRTEPIKAASFPIPAGASHARIATWLSGATSGFVAPGNGTAYSDAWIAVVADSEAEALTAVQAYFDGDTPDTPTRRYVWDGTPHASTSSEYELVASATGPGDSPSLVKGQTPTTAFVNYSNPSLPARSARYTLYSYSESVEFFVPKPAGESLTFRVWGFRTGTAAVSVNGTELVPVSSGASAVIPDGGAYIKLTGVGVITLAGMRVSTDPSNEWKPGRGHSGCAMEGKPQITTYSAGLDLMGMSAKFVEVGAWL